MLKSRGDRVLHCDEADSRLDQLVPVGWLVDIFGVLAFVNVGRLMGA